MPTIQRREFFAAGISLGLGHVFSRAAEQVGLRIGMVQSMFRDVQPLMVQAMSRPLRELIQRQTGLTGEVEILEDADQLTEQLKAKKLQLGVFHGFEFAWARKVTNLLEPLVVTIPPGRKLQACVIVHKNSKFQQLADLKDESVLIPRGTKAHCLLYLDRQRASLPSTTAIPKTKPLLTTEEALDLVVEQEVTAALIDCIGLTGYEKLQPGMVKQLRVLSRSEEFPPAVLAYNRHSVDSTILEKVRKLLTHAHETPAGKPLMMLWNLKGFEDVPADYSEQLDRIAKAYPPQSNFANASGPMSRK